MCRSSFAGPGSTGAPVPHGRGVTLRIPKSSCSSFLYSRLPPPPPPPGALSPVPGTLSPAQVLQPEPEGELGPTADPLGAVRGGRGGLQQRGHGQGPRPGFSALVQFQGTAQRQLVCDWLSHATATEPLTLPTTLQRGGVFTAFYREVRGCPVESGAHTQVDRASQSAGTLGVGRTVSDLCSLRCQLTSSPPNLSVTQVPLAPRKQAVFQWGRAGVPEGQGAALTHRTEGGRSWESCLGASVPSSETATAAAASAPSHRTALTSRGFGWIRAWARQVIPSPWPLSGACSAHDLPTAEWRGAWGLEDAPHPQSQ